uniref:DUF7514 domain-containing protein n=1 Tax=Bionectria ochroleuca TaxID=29856 RepID=A0A8H7KCX3_BIOOC
MAVAEITSHDTMSKPIITLMEDAPGAPAMTSTHRPFILVPHNLDDDLVSRIEKQGLGSTDASEGRAVTKRVPRKLKFQATVEDVSTPLLSASAFPKPAPESAPLSATTEVIPPEAAPSPRGRGSKSQPQPSDDAPRSSSPLVHRSDIDPVIKDKVPSSRSRDVPRVHFQDRSASSPTVATTKVHHNARQNSSRPRAPKETDLSPVDLKWGRLVDDHGQPTKRLENILHGVADYMITEYEPINSLVITPEKLLRLYKSYNCKQELLPFDCLFDCYDIEEYRDLQCVYTALRCEHFLVSSQPGSPPDIPALTPAGFAKWMSMFILATPDQEAYRLDSIVERLPIQCKGAAGEIERLPKQLSRHLLPEKHDEESRVLVLSAYNRAFQRSAMRHAEIESSLVSSRRSSRSTVYANDRQRRARRDDSTPRYSREKRMREPDSPERSKRDRSRRAQSRRRKSEYGDNESTTTTTHRRRHHHSPGRSPQRSPERSSRRRRTDSSPSHHHRTYSPFSTSSRRHSGSGDDAPRQSSPSSRWTMPLFRGRSSIGGSDDHRRRSRDLTPEDTTRQSRRDSEYVMSSSRYPGSPDAAARRLRQEVASRKNLAEVSVDAKLL